MKTILFLGLLSTVTIGSTNAFAEPGGCLKYGAGGAAAGHFVGKGHAIAGGAAGCALGAYKRHQYRKHEATHNQRY